MACCGVASPEIALETFCHQTCASLPYSGTLTPVGVHSLRAGLR